eukprot:gnl/MRDRNA2_/MRDRNA2_96436_c0_seq1.p1 gnl/MRDRNA2_/MRDRNA2_96436_c0~~gnl/MRDRNA2_/MRDRNA2_96436_c0_seq1.p1  ORF type:complete len:304 (-),score=67.32 gnl/MRDRNA2_/MRDRNA2_96436_c0_seq1:41-952(-)
MIPLSIRQTGEIRHPGGTPIATPGGTPSGTPGGTPGGTPRSGGSSKTPPLKDPFAWRENLQSISPANSARSGGVGTPPLVKSPPVTPPSGGVATPPSGGVPSTIASARSMPSARSQFGSVYGAYETPRSSGMSPYVTPNSSARAADFAAVYEDTPVYDAFVVGAKDFRPPPRQAATPSAKSEISSVSLGGASASLDAKTVFSSARHGRHKEVEKSLQAGFDPASTDSFGNTLFHIACQNGNKRIAKLSIKYGGNMDAPNSKGNTGLHFLYAYGYPDIAAYFIEKGADDTVPNENGLPPPAGIK